jgi:hypothetical protein
MGFIPIILTMGGAILLFFMAVNQTLIAKKSAILRLQTIVLEGFGQFGRKYALEPSIASSVLDQIDQGFRQLNGAGAFNKSEQFETQVKIPYRDLKVAIDKYNRLVKKKPYSFVARMMGHREIGK